MMRININEFLSSVNISDTQKSVVKILAGTKIWRTQYQWEDLLLDYLGIVSGIEPSAFADNDNPYPLLSDLFFTKSEIRDAIANMELTSKDLYIDKKIAIDKKIEIANMTSQEFVNKMGAGWNLCNTLEGWHEGLTTEDTSHWETLWGNPVTTKEMIQAVKEMGFNTIRIPVTWRSNVDSTDTIMNSWFNRVEEVVGYILDAGMYCIINVHHDTGAEGAITAELDKIYEMKYKLIRLWSQIATRFAHYDYRLLFEGFNEILNPTVSNLWLGDEDSYKAVNILNQDFVDTVRNIQGNENRFLICAPYGAQSQSQPISAFEIPKDFAKDKLIARVNVYHDSRHEVLKTIDNLQKHIVAKNISCIVTELGLLNPDSTRTDKEKLEITISQVKNLKRLGIGCITWTGSLDRKKLIWVESFLPEAFVSTSNNTGKNIGRLNSGFDLMDTSNYRRGEYSFGSGVYYESDTKISLSTYLEPAYSMYTVTTTVPNMLYLIEQLDKDCNHVTVNITGNYGSFPVSEKTRYLGITLYSDTESYTLDSFKSLLETNTLSIVPHEDAVKISVEEDYYTKEEVDKKLEAITQKYSSLLDVISKKLTNDGEML